MIVENELSHNTAGDHGGGIEAFTNSGEPLLIEKNLFVGNVANGSDGGESGAGAAMSLRDFHGWIHNNTIVGNTATGRWECTGGGIFLDNYNTRFVEIRNNIVANNTGCGLSCYAYDSQITLEKNIFWNNGPTNFGFDRAECPANLSEINLVVDPEFCSPETGDYSLKASSPSLTGEEVIGYYTKAGCPGVAVETTTWSRIKARFRE